MGQIIHHAGAYQPVNGRELIDLLGGGMTLVLDQLPFIRRLEATRGGSKARYIDDLVPFIYDNVSGLQPVYGPKSCMQNVVFARGCSITAVDIKKIHNAISAEIRRVRGDRRIVGLYIQDNRIGDTRKLNQDIHSWVAKARIHLPTICGFAGHLDEPTSSAWTSHIGYYADYIRGNAYDGAPGSIATYSPRGCDMVAVYPYDLQASNVRDAAVNAAATDWKMNKAVWPCDPEPCTFLIFEWTCGSKPCILLNFYRDALSRLGWTPRTPLIGVPQAFGYKIVNSKGRGFVWAQPSEKQLADETAGFCAAGAQSILAWVWHDFDAGNSSLFNSKKLRNGLAAGVKTCQTIWKHQRAAGLK
jgi:hypothetical protein